MHRGSGYGLGPALSLPCSKADYRTGKQRTDRGSAEPHKGAKDDHHAGSKGLDFESPEYLVVI